MIVVTPDLLARHDRAVPRYTSYPTALEFGEGYTAVTHADHLRLAAERPLEPLALYVHLPFCRRRCAFCACHVVVTSRDELTLGYLDAVVAESATVARHLGGRRTLTQLHWGGGTPTYHRPDELVALHQGLLEHFTVAPGAEVSIEVDPRVTTPEHLATLAELGFNRISMGVQDVDPEVQRLIGRNQDWEATVELFGLARQNGLASINLDLIYGLPGQTEATFETTLAEVTRLRPDRVALYSFALVPWKASQQRRLWTDLLPSRETKVRLCTRAHEAFGATGYRAIGMDHFALPDDELAVALDERRLSRTFMGYTAVRAPETIAVGSSGISELAGAYGQDHKRLSEYLTEAGAGRLPIERGVVLTAEDQLRRHVIREVMCNGRVSTAEVAERFGVDLGDHFADELAEMAAPGGAVAEGLAVMSDAGVEATEVGRLFVRNIATAFDAYRGGATPAPATFSRSV
jgi:oxygen-independent coproporphyrinogen III oxidase